MHKDFWLERWAREEIGFHQDEVNPYLAEYWQALNPPHGSEVFVPLCGKSRDMLWLREQGHQVFGIEISPLAVEAFFRENGLAPEHARNKSFEQCAANDIRIVCGDFFDLNRDDLKGVRTVYDRASLVALPPEIRERYADHLMDILPSGSKILLITFEYDQAEMSGPPFAVSPDEVESLYAARADIQLLARIDALDDNPRFRKRGLSQLHENIFLITRN